MITKMPRSGAASRQPEKTSQWRVVQVLEFWDGANLMSGRFLQRNAPLSATGSLTSPEPLATAINTGLLNTAASYF